MNLKILAKHENVKFLLLIQQLLTCSVSVNSVEADREREEREKSVVHVNLADFISMLPKPMPLFEC